MTVGEKSREKKHSFRPQSDSISRLWWKTKPNRSVSKIHTCSGSSSAAQCYAYARSCSYSQIHEPREWGYPAGHYAIQMVSGFNNLPSQPGDRQGLAVDIQLLQ